MGINNGIAFLFGVIKKDGMWDWYENINTVLTAEKSDVKLTSKFSQITLYL